MLRIVRSARVLIGRDAELDALASALRESARLVTITGPGGMGKSTLARAIAEHLVADGSRSGVLTCALDGETTIEALCDAVGQALALAPSAGISVDSEIARLGEALATRGPMLLVLDGVEGLVVATARAVSAWLAAAVELAVLVTSRERLRVSEEHAHELAPLAVPAEGAPAVGPAIDLLLERGGANAASLSAADRAAVGALVRLLDGIPLALELAASRLAIMGPRALLHRLRGGFDLLRGTNRGAPARHETLTATAVGSWLALTPAEQATLAGAAVFRGSFSLRSAEVVLSLSHLADAPPVLDVIQALREKSLLVARPSAGDFRFAMYASIHAFASQQLALSGAQRVIEERHAAHFLDGSGDVLVERDNLLAIVERVFGRGAVDARTAEPALRALIALGPVLVAEGPLQRYAQTMASALEATAKSGADPRLRAHVLALEGSFRRQRGDRSGAHAALGEAHALATKLHERPLAGRVDLELARLAYATDPALAATCLERALVCFRDPPSPTWEGTALRGLARLRANEARSLLERAEALHALAGDARERSKDWRALGLVALDEHRHEDARRSFDHALTLATDARDRRGQALSSALLGLAAHARGDLAEARAVYAAASLAFADIGLNSLEASCLLGLGLVLRELGSDAEAYALFVQARASAHGDEVVAAAALALSRNTNPVGLPPYLAVRFEAAREPSPPPDDVLLVAASGAWFRPAGGVRVSLERRENMARMLARFAGALGASPGVALTSEDLFAVGWPGERALSGPAAHRVRVAVATLRKLGLRSALVTSASGYFLAPEPSTRVV